MLFIVFQENLRNLGYVKPRKTIAREDRLIDNESKKDQFVTTDSSKRANVNLGYEALK